MRLAYILGITLSAQSPIEVEKGLCLNNSQIKLDKILKF